jgi:hypothetical protein
VVYPTEILLTCMEFAFIIRKTSKCIYK